MTLLEKLKELSAQATPGAWDVNPDGAEEWWYSDTIVSSGGVLASCVRGNAELITLSRNHIDSLIAVAEAAKRYVDDDSQESARFYADVVAALAKLEVEA